MRHVKGDEPRSHMLQVFRLVKVKHRKTLLDLHIGYCCFVDADAFCLCVTQKVNYILAISLLLVPHGVGSYAMLYKSLGIQFGYD